MSSFCRAGKRFAMTATAAEVRPCIDTSHCRKTEAAEPANSSSRAWGATPVSSRQSQFARSSTASRPSDRHIILVGVPTSHKLIGNACPSTVS
jgi:hypothetical protein